MPDGVSALAGGSIVGGLFSSSSANKAADAQADAASEAAQVQREALQQQREIYDQNVELQQPWYNAGTNALAAYQYELGLGPMPGTVPQIIEQTSTPAATTAAQTGIGAMPADPWQGTTSNYQAARRMAEGSPFGTGLFGMLASYNQNGLEAYQQRQAAAQQAAAQPAAPTTTYSVNGQSYDTMDAAQQAANALAGYEYQGFQETPGFQYGVDQAASAINSNAAARGMRLSGATLDALATDAQGRQRQEYGTWLDRLGGLSTTGQNAASQTAAAGTNYATAYQTGANIIGNALMAGGDARASGYMGQANALGGTLNNLASIYGYAQSGMFGANPGFGITPSAAGLAAYGYT
ncbi:hypothetical protein [Salipiger thiooxidans]|uniref:hypothetical protein n=1 Tax=Salipiger thiooxidans TaxID=282683 RepID=UPI001CD76DC0|nr:hypothetical protein [Salipiger thiooxidans]MCA0846121.1 hypothetical protein [Salipiger thiooxidans]